MACNELVRDRIWKSSKPPANIAKIAFRLETPRQKHSEQNCRNKAKNSAKQTPLNDQKNSQIYSESASAQHNILASPCADSAHSLPKNTTSEAASNKASGLGHE